MYCTRITMEDRQGRTITTQGTGRWRGECASERTVETGQRMLGEKEPWSEVREEE